MIVGFIRKRKLVSMLVSLAIYNDKGIDWNNHSPSQVESERNKRMAKIKQAAANIGSDKMPAILMNAIENGAIAEDGTGKYVDCAKQIRL